MSGSHYFSWLWTLHLDVANPVESLSKTHKINVSNRSGDSHSCSIRLPSAPRAVSVSVSRFTGQIYVGLLKKITRVIFYH